ncbi:MAG: hypothetical protein WCZ87_02375 [Thiohalobacteraceae bacterium]
MRKINIVGQRELHDYNSVESFSDELEAQGFDYISTLSNDPSPGVYTVRWGHYVADTPGEAFSRDMKTLYRAVREREEAAAAEFTEDCERAGVAAAAQQFAAESGYTGRDAEVFVDGFVGRSIKQANPREEGREGIFRAGKAARNTPDGRRACRALAVKFRSTAEPIRPASISMYGPIANGEC